MTAFTVGQRVTLKANPEEGWSEERGTVLVVEDRGMYVVELDDEFAADESDDGIREIHEDGLELFIDREGYDLPEDPATELGGFTKGERVNANGVEGVIVKFGGDAVYVDHGNGVGEYDISEIEKLNGGYSDLVSDGGLDPRNKYYNKNAPIDGKWDAEHGLGNRNQYNEGSASWHAYDAAYNVAATVVTYVAPRETPEGWASTIRIRLPEATADVEYVTKARFDEAQRYIKELEDGFRTLNQAFQKFNKS